MIRTLAAVVLVFAVVRPAAAQYRSPGSGNQPPGLSLRPFLLVSGERFAARRTFEAAFGNRHLPLWGGGLELVFRGDIFVDLTASRLQKSGQRAFLTDTAFYRLGIPLSVTMTPLEVAGGYRFRHLAKRVIPYVGAGVGTYWYQEQSPEPYSDPSENVDARHSGFLILGGADLRLHRWLGVAVDVQYTRVSGILGQDGLSKAADENDLGGTAARVRLLVGR